MLEKLTLNALENILSSRFKEGFLSLKDLPQPSTFKDMEKATKRIVKAIKNREKITIIGDYDVDGVTSTTIMKLFFDEIEYPVEWIIPNRFKDGYGLSANIIPRIIGTDLAITVDNGISAIYAAQLCKEEGIELIITDHHLLANDIPEAYAIIDQKQDECNFPYSDVCGAQIAWYLIASIKNELNIKINMMNYLELVAIAIIADMMPLLHINRAMVVSGIEMLNKSNRPAIRAFKEHSNKDSITAEDIGFFLAPILNSAGRMEDASYAVDFLSSINIYDARIRLSKLIDFNNNRKFTEEDITQKAIKQVNDNENVLVITGEDWHEGVVGIVAARVSRMFEKPTIILTKDENGLFKGSGRSFSSCDLFSIVSESRELLEKFGGHSSAIGLSLQENNIELFKTQLEKSYINKEYTSEMYDADVIGILEFNDITFDLIEIIKKYEPYGQENNKPKFITKNVKLSEVNTMGKDDEHLRFSFQKNGIFINGVKFKTREVFQTGSNLSIVYTLNENNFRGKTTLQLLIDKIIVIN
ncbi:Single-stranded-DNA-specific exonuclease RecJ [hydrothermal vent metagenome]|uniref:Single-stranded-DNA-specific exonuclease RecJ n=1 Tax=hydrothermal vent metagenome TaxID=652676 RepID=A0A1W1EBD4_9ZZZZ